MFNLLIAKPFVGNYHFILHGGKSHTICNRKVSHKWIIRQLQPGETLPSDRVCFNCQQVAPSYTAEELPIR